MSTALRDPAEKFILRQRRASWFRVSRGMAQLAQRYAHQEALVNVERNRRYHFDNFIG